MKTHRYGNQKEISTGRKYHQCLDCGQVDPVDMDTMSNGYCFPKNATSQQEEAEKLFRNQTHD